MRVSSPSPSRSTPSFPTPCCTGSGRPRPWFAGCATRCDSGGRFTAELGGRGNVRRIETALRTAEERLNLQLSGSPWYFPGVGEYASLLEAEGLEVRYAVLFDRATPLEGEDGLREWVKMFGRAVLDAIPAERREAFLTAVEEAARPELYRDGGWFADYRRLRVTAVRLS